MIASLPHFYHSGGLFLSYGKVATCFQSCSSHLFTDDSQIHDSGPASSHELFVFLLDILDVSQTSQLQIPIAILNPSSSNVSILSSNVLNSCQNIFIHPIKHARKSLRSHPIPASYQLVLQILSTLLLKCPLSSFLLFSSP